MFREVVDEIKSKVIECNCLARDASIERFKAQLALEHALEQIKRAKNRMAIVKLRQLQIEARIDSLLEKGNQTDT